MLYAHIVFFVLSIEILIHVDPVLVSSLPYMAPQTSGATSASYPTRRSWAHRCSRISTRWWRMPTQAQKAPPMRKPRRAGARSAGGRRSRSALCLWGLRLARVDCCGAGGEGESRVSPRSNRLKEIFRATCTTIYTFLEGFVCGSDSCCTPTILHGIELSNASMLSAISPIESSRADAARRHDLTSNHKTCLHS